MRRDGLFKHVAITFGIALAVYTLTYAGCEHERTRLGPWEVAFTNDATGTPALRINHPRLAITNVLITFPGETMPARAKEFVTRFDQPRPVPFDVPFGRCLFMDTTFLPGTVAFDLFGHQIQLIPRVLTIDHREQAWRSDTVISVQKSELSGHARSP